MMLRMHVLRCGGIGGGDFLENLLAGLSPSAMQVFTQETPPEMPAQQGLYGIDCRWIRWRAE